MIEITDVLIQWILVAIIVSLALLYAVRRLLQFFRKKSKSNSNAGAPDDCNDCAKECDSCPLNSDLNKYYTKD